MVVYRYIFQWKIIVILHSEEQCEKLKYKNRYFYIFLLLFLVWSIYIIYIYIHIYIYIYIYILYVYIFLESMLHYLTSPSDVIYLIHMQKEGTVVNERNTACHGVNLVLDLNQKVLKFFVFLSNSYLYFSVFVLELQLMYI